MEPFLLPLRSWLLYIRRLSLNTASHAYMYIVITWGILGNSRNEVFTHQHGVKFLPPSIRSVSWALLHIKSQFNSLVWGSLTLAPISCYWVATEMDKHEQIPSWMLKFKSRWEQCRQTGSTVRFNCDSVTQSFLTRSLVTKCQSFTE